MHALTTLPALPPAAFAAPWGAVSARSLCAHTVAALPALCASIVFRTTGDGDKVSANAGCDADAATTGEQCTLRAALQRACIRVKRLLRVYGHSRNQPRALIARAVD